MKLYLGAADLPIHPQHLEIMGNVDEWTFVDKFVQNKYNKPWDAETLVEVKDNSVEKIYASHLLEHFSHTKIQTILETWYNKLKEGGELIINVPDFEWSCRKFIEILDNERNNKPNSGYYNKTISPEDHEHDFLQIFYGSHSHEGEYHKCGFTEESIRHLLKNFKKVQVKRETEAHDMQCLIIHAIK